MNENLKMRDILEKQKKILTELEREVSVIENSDLVKENDRLKSELGKLNGELAHAAQNSKTLHDENLSLKNALYEQIYSEKAKIAEISREKLDILFKNTYDEEINKLILLENSIKNRINNMKSALIQNRIDTGDELHRKLAEIEEQVNVRLTAAQRQFAEDSGAFSKNEREEMDALKNGQVTEEQILAITKKNNLERLIGLNVINAIGILLIIIGVIAGARYTYVLLPDTLKGVMMFALGAAMLVAGEIMNRKKPNVFSLGITAGGAGVLYAAIATSYFGLKIIGMYPALGLCVLITAVTFLLSTRYNSQVILAMALVGGYLPILSTGPNIALLYGLMAYFAALNLLALLVSFRKKWIVTTFIGLALNIPGTLIVSSGIGYDGAVVEKAIAIGYVLFTFLIYTLIPVAGAYMNKVKFRIADVILLAINTTFSSLIMYFLFYSYGWLGYTGAYAAVFAAVYLALGWFFERKLANERHARALFYLTGLTFAVLIVPFQFGRMWLTFGWLVEGVALAVYGIITGESRFKRAGMAINALCLFSFIFVDWVWGLNFLFAQKYLAVTLGSLLILAAYAYKKTLSGGFQKVFKYAASLNFWFYLLYACYKLSQYAGRADAGLVYRLNINYLFACLAAALTFLAAFMTLRIKILSDAGMKIIAVIEYVSGMIGLFYLNSFSTPYYQDAPIQIKIAGGAVLVLISLLSVLALYDLLKLIVMERRLGIEWFPLIVSAYSIIILTQNLITQYGLSFASAWISIIYVLTAFGWILFGFAKRFPFIRKFGLGLALLAVAKLFVVDLAGLTQGYRIISYFALGVTLVAISFVYQYFSKRLELKLK